MDAVETRLLLDDHLPYLINRIATNGVRIFQFQLDSADITVPMWRVIIVLWTKGPQRQIDLSDLTSIDRSTLSRLIGSLTKRKLVTRARSLASSREVTINITEKGEALARKFAPLAQQYEDAQLFGLSDAEKATLKRLLHKVYDNIINTLET